MNNDEQYREKLTPEQFHITREKGTEAPFTGQYNDHKAEGTYTCICCGAPLFKSDSKYDSGSGWPSFYQSIDSAAIDETEDRSLARIRTEITCHQCDSHLGHVFPDGPRPTGLRYCVNSASLNFTPKDE